VVIGVANCIVIVWVCGFVLQVAPADVIVTGDGPVIIKSLPLAATERQFNGMVKLSTIEDGAQDGGVTVPIGRGGCSARVNAALLPALTNLPH
jgi:hypothetical protein